MILVDPSAAYRSGCKAMEPEAPEVRLDALQADIDAMRAGADAPTRPHRHMCVGQYHGYAEHICECGEWWKLPGVA